jgi:dihydrofolate synthase/folylpolyglutamate synthase
MPAMTVFDKLQSLRGQSVVLGLAQITRLLDELDHPERDFPAVHVAGTNGKGSVCAMAAAALERAGHRVGLLTSPHLVDFAERIRVNGRRIREEEAVPILETLDEAGGFRDGSFFEVTTALAFEHFRRKGVDVAVVEVGLGGRLDATNVCFPRVTAITNIDLDHMKTLGPDRPAIAAEKAGIVKPGVPLVLGRTSEEASPVIEAIASQRGAPLLSCADLTEVRVLASSWEGLEVSIRLPGERHRYARIPLPGRHQADNLAVAALAARTFDPREGTLDALLEGLEATHWPGRLQRAGSDPVRIYDVAHNRAGAEALVQALEELGIPEDAVLLVGVLADKDHHEMAQLLARSFRRAVATTPPHPLRARPAAETALALEEAGIETIVQESAGEACTAAGRLAGKGGWVVVTGSLFTVGAAMDAFGDSVEVKREIRSGTLGR